MSPLRDIPVLQPRPPAGVDDALSLRRAAQNIADDLRGQPCLTVVLNDPQRGTASRAVLDALLGVIGPAPFRALVATGSHSFPPAIRADFEREMFAGLNVRAVAWHVGVGAELAQIGSWRGHPWLTDGDDPLLGIGSCEMHYFAGITGAHKTVTIGCAAYPDIEANHAGALSPRARPGALAGNPIHDGVVAMLADLQARRPVRVVNLLQLGGQVVAASGGEPLAALAQLAPLVRSAYTCSIPEPADCLVLDVEGPLAGSFYQADKGIKNNEWAVRDGGTLILSAPCPAGIGQSEFTRLLGDCPDYESILSAVQRNGYRLGDHKAVKLRYLTDRRGVRVYVVSDGLTPAAATLLGLTKSPSIEWALDHARLAPARHRLWRVKDAGNTVTIGIRNP